MQYDIELMHTFGIKALKLILYTIFFYHFDYDVETWYWSAFLYYSEFTSTLKIAWNKHGRYKEG